MSFYLREHVRQILAVTPGENLDDLVEAVFAATPVDAYATAYRQALAPVIRTSLASAERPEPEAARLDHLSADIQESLIEPGQDTDGEAAISLSKLTGQSPLPVGPNLRNSRAARLLRRNRFRRSISIGGGIYRDILDCTMADLERAAAESEQLASENQAAADRYRKLVKIMAEYNAETVNDLSEDQLTDVFGDE